MFRAYVVVRQVADYYAVLCWPSMLCVHLLLLLLGVVLCGVFSPFPTCPCVVFSVRCAGRVHEGGDMRSGMAFQKTLGNLRGSFPPSLRCLGIRKTLLHRWFWAYACRVWNVRRLVGESGGRGGG